MRKRLRYSMLSLLQSLIVRTVILRGTQPPELEDMDGEQNKPLIIQEQTVSNLLLHLHYYECIAPDGIHPMVLTELAEMLAKPHTIIYQQSWATDEVPDDWRLVSVRPIYKNDWKEDLGNYKLVSLTSVSGKVMEQIVLNVITEYVQDNWEIRPSQREFMKVRSCLTNPISFYDRVTRIVDEGKAVGKVYLDFRKAFDTVSHGILLEKLAAHGLDQYTLHWGKNWLSISFPFVFQQWH